MSLRRIRLRSFRNFAEVDLELAEGFTVLWGHNGAGKTNVLEAIWLVSTLRSFRTADLGPLVRHASDAASVELHTDDPVLGVPSTLEVRLTHAGTSTRRTAVADGKTVRAAAQFYGRVRAVLFTPEDLGVVRGSPSGRRQFLDRVLFARDRAHIGDVQSYEKLLRSRNRVLKDAMPPAERERLLESYEEGLAEVGARLWTRRAELLAALAHPFADNFARIHGAGGSTPAAQDAPSVEATLRYEARLGDVPAPEREAFLRAALAERRPLDERRGSTSVGPHRDDLVVEIDGRPAAELASQGQCRALVLAFKLAEVGSTRALLGVPPLLLLDDVSSELDPQRTILLFRALAQDAGQCVITTTSPDYIELPSGVSARHLQVDRGVVQAVHRGG
jgi:DNA replication and repair protein RecF